MPDNFSQKIIDNVQPSSQKSNFASSSDLDKIKATHSRRMTRLTNIYEFLTHKTILLLIAIILFTTFVVSRYYSIFHISVYQNKRRSILGLVHIEFHVLQVISAAHVFNHHPALRVPLVAQ